MHNKILKKICWAMVFILFISWSGIPQNVAHAQKTARLNEEERKKAVEKLEKLFDVLEEVAKEIPRDTFDPKVIVDKVGKDPIKLFEWIRDNTYLVPYRGSLRGPIGVLMDRLGNSLDRALLLHELLTITGYEARLAQGILSEKEAKRLLKDARPIPPDGPLPNTRSSPEELNELLNKYAENSKFDKKELQKAMDRLTIEQQQLLEEVTQRTADQTAQILAMLDEVGVDTSLSGEGIRFNALRDHWWVQWQTDVGWLDMDPSLPNARAGGVLTEAENTHRLGDLRDDLNHLVDMRVIIERFEEGKLSELKVLEHTMLPSELFGQRIVLRHVPMNWPEGLNLFEEEEPLQRLKAVVLEEKEWLPVLVVDGNPIYQKSFTDTGDVKAPKKEAVQEVTETQRSIFGMIADRTGGKGAEEEPKKESHLTAEWVEYEIHLPGEPPRKIRRELFDLVGAEVRSRKGARAIDINDKHRVRRGLGLLAHLEVMLQPVRPSGEYISHHMVSGLLKARDVLMQIKSATGPAKETNDSERVRPLLQIWSPVHGLVLARNSLPGWGSQTYFERPNILTYELGFRMNRNSQVLVYEEFDLVENFVAATPRSGTKAFEAALRQGVLDTIIESYLLSGPGIFALNTANVFAYANRTPAQWHVFKSPDDAAWIANKKSFPEHVRTMIDKELEQNVVLVAEKPYGIHITQDAFVWWRINPLSGATVGVSDHGRGASLVEHLIKITIVGGICLISAVCWVLFGGPEAYERCIASGKDPGYCYASSMAGPAYKTFRILAFFATLLKFPLLMFPIWAATHVEHD